MKNMKFWSSFIALTLMITVTPSWAAPEAKAAAETKAAVVKAEAKTSSADKTAVETKTSPDDKMAVINGQIITRKTFDQEMKPIKQRLKAQPTPQDSTQMAGIQKKVLKDLIRRELLLQESEKKGIKVTDEEVSKQLSLLKKQFPDEAKFTESLKGMGLSLEIIKDQIRQQQSIQKLIEDQVVSKINISDADSKNYYDQNPKFFKESEKVKASHILVKVDPKADEAKKAEAKKKIEDVQKKLAKGGDFAKLAKEFSDCPSKEKGGDLGFFGRGQMVKPFETVAFALEIGKLSDIVETQFGYHIIKVMEKKPESVKAYAEIKDRIQQVLKRKKVREDMEKYIENLEKSAKIEMFI